MNRVAGREEDPHVHGIPLAAGMTAVGVEPPAVAIVLDAEQARAAVGAHDGLHGDPKPLAAGLVLVLLAQRGTHLGRAESPSASDPGSEDLRLARAAVATELEARGLHELELLGFLGERRPPEDVASPVGEATADGLDRRSHRLGRLVATDVNGAPDGHRRPRVLLAEEALERLHPHEPVGSCDALPERDHRSSQVGRSDIAEHVLRHGRPP